MKQKLITEERVFEDLKKAIVETLRVDEAAITNESSFIRDLGAESLDFLDINYRLEQAFGVKMARHFVLEHVEEMFGEGSAIDDEGRLTEKAIVLLKERMGENLEGLQAGMDMDELPSFVTVGSMAQGVMDILDSLPEKCSQCGHGEWKSEDGAHVLCASCGAPASFKNGDDLILDWLMRVQEEKQIF